MKDFLTYILAGLIVSLVMTAKLVGICLVPILAYLITGIFTDDSTWQWVFAAVALGGYFVAPERTTL